MERAHSGKLALEQYLPFVRGAEAPVERPASVLIVETVAAGVGCGFVRVVCEQELAELQPLLAPAAVGIELE